MNWGGRRRASFWGFDVVVTLSEVVIHGDDVINGSGKGRVVVCWDFRSTRCENWTVPRVVSGECVSNK